MSALYMRTDLNFDYGVYQSLVMTEGGNIDDYIKQLSQFLRDKSERVNKSVGELETTEWIEIPEELMEGLGSFFMNNTNKTIHNALFVMINSFIEWAIIELCRLTAIYIGDDFLNYKNGSGLKKAKNYLKEKLGISIAEDTDWLLFTDNQAVRNLIVHNGSNIIKDYSKGVDDQPDKDIFQKNSDHFEYTETGFIFILKMEYIQDSHNTAKKFVAKHSANVMAELKKRIVK